ncbi:acetyl-CoA hydrolase/transferase family protein [Roseivirga sp. BDSF3-8]|uniref:acetyl-CoA hydrolase/transferase family protein n=1 Tax=Roseivirga sp. BDSF3-8 TaxID=3241598 RepID=UPI0035322544
MSIKYTTAEEAVKVIKSGHRVFLHSAAATPVELVKAMTARHEELRNVEIVSIHTEGPVPYAEEQYKDSFNINTFFVGKNIRPYVNSGRASYIPMFLSEIPDMFRRGLMPVDVAMVTVSPPDKHGFVSLGCSVDVSNAAVDTAKYVIAQVNPNMPKTIGDGTVHISRFHALVESDDPIFELHAGDLSEVEMAIGKNVAGLIEDGATLQMGIGAIPNAVLATLGNHKDLGIHTEMFSDGIIELVEKGVINGVKKKVYPEKIVSGFVIGSRKVYDFIDDNPMVMMLDVGEVNDTKVIRKNPKVTAINSALEIDIFGQVCADSIGPRQYSGVGGQMDFVRGASLSSGGKPIIALPSATGKGISRIVSTLKPNASVVTTRAHVHYVVTEYGVAYLYGKNLKERTKALIDVAHPAHREQLEKESFQILNGGKM